MLYVLDLSYVETSEKVGRVFLLELDRYGNFGYRRYWYCEGKVIADY